jgi:hypothetical protein
VKQLFRASSDQREMREACQLGHYGHCVAQHRLVVPSFRLHAGQLSCTIHRRDDKPPYVISSITRFLPLNSTISPTRAPSIRL